MLEEGDNFNIFGDRDENDDSFQRQVLVVPDIENADLSGPPMDGYQFLQRVVLERKKIDDIVVKKAPTKTQKRLGDQILQFPDEKSDSAFIMDKKTQLHILSQFSKLRLKYEARCKQITPNELKRICKSLPIRNEENEENHWLKLLSHSPPNLSEGLESPKYSVELCLAISQTRINPVMELISDWISDGELSVPLACQWIYTLLAALELPMDPDLCATLRHITRTLISLRARLESFDAEELPHINIIICIVGRYFNQLDLADPLD